MKLISQEKFDIFITTDKNLPFQQNLSNLTYALWVLDTPSNKISTLKLFVPEIIKKIDSIPDGNLPPKTLEYISVLGISSGKKLMKINP